VFVYDPQTQLVLAVSRQRGVSSRRGQSHYALDWSIPHLLQHGRELPYATAERALFMTTGLQVAGPLLYVCTVPPHTSRAMHLPLHVFVPGGQLCGTRVRKTKEGLTSWSSCEALLGCVDPHLSIPEVNRYILYGCMGI